MMRTLKICMISLTIVACSKQESERMDSIEDLKVINSNVVDLIDDYNRKHHTNWISLGVNLKVVVEKCTKPMTAKWEMEQLENKKQYWQVKVTCPEVVNNKKGWSVTVPTTRYEVITR